jgi:hypothetical protein
MTDILTSRTGYEAFLARKQRVSTGEAVSRPLRATTALYPWQAHITRWALRRGRCAIFADCGLGKTRMQVAWAATVPGRVLIFAPLCVAEQTINEGRAMGVDVTLASSHPPRTGITITNYERLGHYDLRDYTGVVLDESSILKSFDGKTRTALIERCAGIPYRLCCTATPSPNDIAELANHAEFLGLCTRPEFLATWFLHDDTGWRMKRHAVDPFFAWIAQWAFALQHPREIGYPDDRFTLPPLRIHDEVVSSSSSSSVVGVLFPELAMKGIGGRLAVRRGTIADRIDRLFALTRDSSRQWIVWCGLNGEADAATAAIAGAEQVRGSDSYEDKARRVRGFVDGEIRVLVSKPRILGFGMNFQHCARMAFLGLSDSYESYYQCIRRCWRFGQRQPVDVHVIVSDAERLVVENVRRKQRDASLLTSRLIAHHDITKAMEARVS